MKLKNFLVGVSEFGRKHTTVFGFAFVILGGVFIFGHSAHAEIQSYLGEAISWFFSLVGFIFGMLLTYVVIPTLLQTMQFSNFINSAPVVAGWVVVRDFTNLLFIIVLLVIAFGIIFGVDKYGKIEMIPQLFIVSIAINFSRTIVGFLTDISQVFMATFVNAFADAGAGNFISVFSVDVSKNYSADSGFVNGVDAMTSVVVANIASAVMLVCVTIILGYLAVIMLVRIVTIWILIILAPLAWFCKLIEPWGIHTYSDWWKELRGQLTLGPIMAFFVWLALATASGAGSEFANAPSPSGTRPDANAKFAPTDSATMQAVVKAIIAIAILFKGLEVAQAQGGAGASLLGKAGDMAKKAGKGVGALGAAGAAYTASASLRAGMRMGGKTAEEGGGRIRQGLARYGKATSLSAPLMADVGAGVTGLATSKLLNKAPGGAFIQRKVQAFGGKIADRGESQKEEHKKALEKEALTGTPETKAKTLAFLNDPANKDSLSADQKVQQEALNKSFMEDSKAMTELAKGPNGSTNVKNAMKAVDDAADKISDPVAKRKAQHGASHFTAANLEHLKDKDGNPDTASRVAKINELKAHGHTSAFSEIQTGVLKDAAVQEAVGAEHLTKIMKDPKNSDDAPAIAAVMSTPMAAEVAKGIKDEEQVSSKTLQAFQPAAAMEFTKNLKPDVLAEVMSKKENATALVAQRSAFVALATAPPPVPPAPSATPEEKAKYTADLKARTDSANSIATVKHDSPQTTALNINFHAAEAVSKGGVDKVDTEKTLGYKLGGKAGVPGYGFVSDDAQENFEAVATNARAMATWAKSADMGAVSGEPGEAVALKGGSGIFRILVKEDQTTSGGIATEKKAVINKLLKTIEASAKRGNNNAKSILKDLNEDASLKGSFTIPPTVT
ncbi:MAG: hypothetical protein WCJ29_00525 [bacterium]